MTALAFPGDLDALAARDLIDGMRRDVADLGERITTAYLGRAWLSLGYSSWDALCEAEFDGARLRLPREDRAEQVQSLRSAGLSTRAIGSALGVSPQTVTNDLGRLSTSGQSAPQVVQSLDAHVADNAAAVNSSAAKESRRFSALAPYLANNATTEDAIKAWQDANPGALLP